MGRDEGYHRRTSAMAVGRVDDAAIKAWLSPAKSRRMGRPSRLASAAAAMAIEDAGLDGEPESSETAVVVATSFGPAVFTERLLLQIFREQPTAASPALFTESVANAPAAQIALTQKARGPNVTITQRESGPCLAVNQACRMIRSGRVDRVLVGAVDEVSQVLHAALERFRVLAPGDDPEPRPYDLNRNGFVLAEGATVLLLERADRALSKKSYGEVTAGGAAFDPRASPTGYGPDGEFLGESLSRGLDRMGWSADSLDCIVTAASGSRVGDLADAQVLRQVFEPCPTVLTPKAVAGHCGAALLAGAVLARAGSPVRVLGFRHPSPEVGVLPYTGGEFEAPQRLLCSALSAGGASSWFGLQAPEQIPERSGDN